MSGFEVIGVILGLYPIIGTALVAYKATKGGKGAKKLIRDLKVEKVIFRDFVHNLLAPNVTEAELVRLKDLDCHDATSWTNAAVAATGRLGLEKATLIIEILLEICDLLKSLQTGLSPSNRGTGTDHGVVWNPLAAIDLSFYGQWLIHVIICRTSFENSMPAVASSKIACQSRVLRMSLTN